jgi:PTS system fructose-specific IIA component/PTS system nitrogen regulatory IIA component
MRLSELICSTAILEGGSSIAKEELIRQMLLQLAIEGHLAEADVPSVLEAVMRRERLASTGIGRGVAVPHGKHAAVSRRLGVLALCRTPVEFDSIDGLPTDIFVLLLAPSERPGFPLRVSPPSDVLIRRLADEKFTEGLRQSKSAEEIAAFLRATEGLQ